MDKHIRQSISATKEGFEKSFEAEEYYNKQTRDDLHLESILNCLQVTEGTKILDLGTGTGYLAFALAEKYPEAEVTGLDIVEDTLRKNRSGAEASGLKNLQFISYDGLSFPFADQEFDMITTRYALHHFPDMNGTFQEISRVLKQGGSLFLSDPSPNEQDTRRFVDAYMQMKKDGHIKFYTKAEWLEITKRAGMEYCEGFESQIRFPKKLNAAPEWEKLVKEYEEEVIGSYQVKIIADEIWITEKVNNLLFQKE